MRSISDFTNALELIVGQAMGQCSPEQLDAVGGILEGLGTMAKSAARLKHASAGVPGQPAMTAPGVAHPPVPRSSPPASGTGAASPLPAPAQAASPAPANAFLHQPPPEHVECEEAHHQRNDSNRIPNLRADPVVYLQQLGYYVLQIGALYNKMTPDDPLLGPKHDEIMLSIECLPGTCPKVLTGPADESLTLAEWKTVHGDVKALVGRQILDPDDEQQILHKMGDRPGGSMDPMDFSNDKNKAARKPGLVMLSGMLPGDSDGPVMAQPGDTGERAIPPAGPGPSTAGTPPPPIPEAPVNPNAHQFGNETIVVPDDQGRVAPSRPVTEIPVAMPPGGLLVNANGTMTAFVGDITLELKNPTKLMVALAREDLELFLQQDQVKGVELDNRAEVDAQLAERGREEETLTEDDQTPADAEHPQATT